MEPMLEYIAGRTCFVKYVGKAYIQYKVDVQENKSWLVSRVGKQVICKSQPLKIFSA